MLDLWPKLGRRLGVGWERAREKQTRDKFLNYKTIFNENMEFKTDQN